MADALKTESTQSTPFTTWVDDALHHAHRMSTDEAYRQEVALRINPLLNQAKQDNKL